MGNDNLDTIILGSSRPIYCTFRDENSGALVDVDSPTVSIWDTNDTKVVDEQALTKEATGIYYYVFTASTSLSTATGLYEAWFRGVNNSREISQKKPRYINVIEQPTDDDRSYDFISHIRRYIGDIDASDYRYQNYEIAGFIYTAFVNLKYDYYKYTSSRITTTLIISFDTLTFSEDLSDDLTYLLILETLLLIKESEWNERSSQVGYIKTGDMVIDPSKGSGEQYKYLRATKEDLQDDIKRVALSGVTGSRIFTFGDGTSGNSYIR